MKLINLKLRNFKGIGEFDLEPFGESQAIFGDNGTGKTTLFDAFSWLLFDKDSANRKDFEIKTLGVDGEPVHGLEHEVEGVLEIGGRQLSLKKVYSENWTKKRGSLEREFTGHTTNYFLDGVPTKKNEYEARIASVIDEDAFKLLTNPRHFNEVLHWQDRRKLLLEVCGDLSDAEVIASDSKLAKLPELLNGRKLEDHCKVIAARRSEINKDIEKIPVRISEVQRGLPDAINAPGLKTELEDLKEKRNTKARELANLEAGGGVAELTKELRVIEAELLQLENEHRSLMNTEAQSTKVELGKLENESDGLKREIQNKQRRIEANQESAKVLEGTLNTYRQDWSVANSENFTFEQSDTCPACGQSLPPEQLEAARDKALAIFNSDKAERLEKITKNGKLTGAEVERLRHETSELEQEIADAQPQLDVIAKQITDAQDKVSAIEAGAPFQAHDDTYAKKQALKQAIELDIEKLKATNSGAVEAVRLIISAIDTKIADCESAIAQIKQREAGLQRIEELKVAERTLAKEFERLEGELYLTEQFVRAKVSLLEDRINSRFELARFKLFNQLVNGGVEEVCETIYLGVPYSSALNNSARINIGLDIINTLSEHFQFDAPIWIDNAEAVTQLLQTKGQQIRLYVSEADKVLRIEEAKEAVAI